MPKRAAPAAMLFGECVTATAVPPRLFLVGNIAEMLSSTRAVEHFPAA
jgi:hypothetical protein